MVAQNIDSHVNLGKTLCLVIKPYLCFQIHEMGGSMAFMVPHGYILIPVCFIHSGPTNIVVDKNEMSKTQKTMCICG